MSRLPGTTMDLLRNGSRTLLGTYLVPARLHQPCRGTSQYRCDFRVFPAPMGRRSRDLCEMESAKTPRILSPPVPFSQGCFGIKLVMPHHPQIHRACQGKFYGLGRDGVGVEESFRLSVDPAAIRYMRSFWVQAVHEPRFRKEAVNWSGFRTRILLMTLIL